LEPSSLSFLAFERCDCGRFDAGFNRLAGRVWRGSSWRLFSGRDCVGLDVRIDGVPDFVGSSVWGLRLDLVESRQLVGSEPDSAGFGLRVEGTLHVVLFSGLNGR
jgi:hypothetical protein